MARSPEKREVIKASSTPPNTMNQDFNLAMLLISLESAANREGLIEVAQQIQHAPHHWQREKAGRIVQRRLTEFKKR